MKLIVPIVNRTNYSKLKLVLKNLKEMGVDVLPVLSSGLLMPKYGKDDIFRDFSDCREIDCLLASDTLESMVKTVGLSMIEHSSLFSREKPVALLAIGDRFDYLPPVLAARMMNIKVLHIQGGEKSGSIDNVIRDLISVCSCRHYVATTKAEENVLKLTGSKHVYNFGCPAVEALTQVEVGETFYTKQLNPDLRRINLERNEDYFLVMVHPNTTDDDVDMEMVMRSVLSFDIKTIVVSPNIDAFSSRIVSSIESHRDQVIFVKHFPFEDFVKIMAHCRCMIGNSSSGIREASSFGVSVVNIGQRQEGRERNTNVIDCMCNYEMMTASIEYGLKSTFSKENIYYKPMAARRIANNVVEMCHEKI